MKADPIALRAERRILLIQGQMVILDYDLAILYEKETCALEQAVRRNLDRFLVDFMFELTGDETAGLVSQNVIPGSAGWAAPRPWRLPSRASPCCAEYRAARRPCRSTSPSCALLSGSAHRF